MKAAMERMQARARLPRAAPGTPAPCPAWRLCSGARLRRARLRARGAAPRAARRRACSRCTSTRFPCPPVSVWCSPHQGARRARQRRRPAVGAQQRRAARRRSSWRPGRQRRRRGRRRRSSWPWPASARARSGAGAVPSCPVAVRRAANGPTARVQDRPHTLTPIASACEPASAAQAGAGRDARGGGRAGRRRRAGGPHAVAQEPGAGRPMGAHQGRAAQHVQPRARRRGLLARLPRGRRHARAAGRHAVAHPGPPWCAAARGHVPRAAWAPSSGTGTHAGA